MTVRFQADADLNAEIVAGVQRREPSIDFQMADEANLRRLRDPKVLALAAQENRILVTHDRRTMPRHFADFILHHSSPGVFIIAQTMSVRVAIEELLLDVHFISSLPVKQQPACMAWVDTKPVQIVEVES